jgi:hypothetical protein
MAADSMGPNELKNYLESGQVEFLRKIECLIFLQQII